MKKSYYVIAVVLGLLITTVAVSFTTLAFGPNFDPENHQAIRQAVTDGDYGTWAEAMQAKVDAMREQADELEARINEETFNKIQEAHQLVQEGDIEGARAIFEELGMAGPGPGMNGKGFQKGLHLGKRFGDQQ